MANGARTIIIAPLLLIFNLALRSVALKTTAGAPAKITGNETCGFSPCFKLMCMSIHPNFCRAEAQNPQSHRGARPGASKGIPGDVKCVTEILRRGGGKNKEVAGTKFKYGQLILMEIIKIVATRCHILRLKCTKFDFDWGSASPGPRGELTALPQTP